MRHFLLMIRREGAPDFARIERIEARTCKEAHAAALSKHWAKGARILSTRKGGKGRTYVGVQWFGDDNRARHDSALFIETAPPVQSRVAHDGRARAYNDD